MKRKELHLKPLKNWMNDPNGLIYHNGLYHVYYQYFPYATQWGTMHWGHVTTSDFYEWEQHDIALFPSIFEDKNGCYSGSAIKIDNNIYFYYTGVNYINQVKNNIHLPLDNKYIATQLLITSKDGFTFDNFTMKKIVIPPIEDERVGDKNHTRDPKVWFHNGFYYIVLGTKKRLNDRYVGGVLLYKSHDGLDFQLINSLFDEAIGDMWECPDIFTINEQTYLVMSPEKLFADGNYYTNNSIVLKLHLDYEKNILAIDKNYRLQDIGLDAYASQTFLDENNQRVMLSWLRMPRAINNSIGMMTMPRVLREENGELCYSVHCKITDKFTIECKIAELTPKRIKTSLLHGDTINIHGYIISYADQVLKFDRHNCIDGNEKISLVNKISIDGKVDLDIFFNFDAIETSINHGEFVCSHVIEKYNSDISIVNEYSIKKMKY